MIRCTVYGASYINIRRHAVAIDMHAHHWVCRRAVNTPAASPAAATDGVAALQWRLDMRDARAFPGIAYPLENGLGGRCIPGPIMAAMNADLHPAGAPIMVHRPADPALPPEHTASQVGDWVFANLKFENSACRRTLHPTLRFPILTIARMDQWDHEHRPTVFCFSFPRCCNQSHQPSLPDNTVQQPTTCIWFP